MSGTSTMIYRLGIGLLSAAIFGSVCGCCCMHHNAACPPATTFSAAHPVAAAPLTSTCAPHCAPATAFHTPTTAHYGATITQYGGTTTQYGGTTTPYGGTTTQYGGTTAHYGGTSAPSVASQSVTIGLYDNYFQPATITIAPGTTVRWVNYGRHAHTVTSNDRSWDSGDVQ